MAVIKPFAKPSWLQDAAGDPLPSEQFLQLVGTAVTSLTDDPANKRTIADLTAGGGGGGGAGLQITKYPFAYNTPNLATGHTVKTFAADELLIDAWVQITQGWNASPGFLDIGDFSYNGYGAFSNAIGWPLEIHNQDGETPENGNVGSTSMLGAGAFLIATGMLTLNAFGQPLTQHAGLTEMSSRMAPYHPGENPAFADFQIVVSQDGSINTPAPGATQGAGILYLVTATP